MRNVVALQMMCIEIASNRSPQETTGSNSLGSSKRWLAAIVAHGRAVTLLVRVLKHRRCDEKKTRGKAGARTTLEFMPSIGSHCTLRRYSWDQHLYCSQFHAQLCWSSFRLQQCQGDSKSMRCSHTGLIAERLRTYLNIVHALSACANILSGQLQL